MKGRRPLLFAALIALGLLVPATGQAVVTVNTTADNGAALGECSGAPGDCSLRQAIDKATPGETIEVPPGHYVLNGSALGLFKSVTINGSGARATTVDSNGLTGTFVPGGATTSTLRGMTITGGHRVGSGFLDGGAIDSTADSLTLDQVNLSGTTQESTGATTARGGAITVRGVGPSTPLLTITNSTIANNVQNATGAGSNQGGAIFASGALALTITNSTIANNTQQDAGSDSSEGSAITSIATPVTLNNVTVAGNSGSAALTATLSTLFSLHNTLLANAVNCDGAATSLGHNLENANFCGLNNPTDQISKDPLLGPLANYGGQTDTMSIAPPSPAIDTGDAVGCPPADQRGVTRPLPLTCDIGAFEYVPGATPDRIAPATSELKLKPTAFRPLNKGGSIAARKRKKAPRGTTVSYKLSEAATVAFTVERKLKGRKRGKKCSTTRKRGKRCTTYKAVKGSFSQAGKAGANSLKFSGRVNGKKLRRGSYRLTAISTDAAGNRGVAVRKAFRIVR